MELLLGVGLLLIVATALSARERVHDPRPIYIVEQTDQRGGCLPVAMFIAGVLVTLVLLGQLSGGMLP